MFAYKNARARTGALFPPLPVPFRVDYEQVLPNLVREILS